MDTRGLAERGDEARDRLALEGALPEGLAPGCLDPERSGQDALSYERLAQAKGVLFDMDGTLFAFERGAGEIGQRLIFELTHGDRDLSQTLASSAGFEPAMGSYSGDSPIANGDWAGLAQAWAPVLQHWREDELETWFQMEAASLSRVSRSPASDDLSSLLARFSAAGVALGVATQGEEAPTQNQLARAGVADAFEFVAGRDSGFAPKPDRAMLDGFCAAVDLEPHEVVVVGDSLGDLRMANAGGALAAVGVLSGPAGADILAPEADLLLPSISDLPDALNI